MRHTPDSTHAQKLVRQNPAESGPHMCTINPNPASGNLLRIPAWFSMACLVCEYTTYKARQAKEA